MVVVALAGGAAHGQPLPGDVAAGRQLAETWCSSCHLVSPEQTETTTEAPPFAAIAEQSGDDFSWLRTFLLDTHPPMPQFSLSRQEIQNLVAYIASLDQL
jgi:mono/diheme cytochrome c family protein